jgi:hypothetical protein
MAEQSSITSSDLAAVTAGATACDHLTELANTRTKFATFLDWIVSDPSGNLATDFKTAVINQLLFDAAKKGWLVATDATTGYLELIEKLALASLDDTGAASGDLIRFNGTDWVKHTPFLYEPASGSVTVPDPDVGGVISVAHSLGYTPSGNDFSCYIECNSPDAGYADGDRVSVECLMQVGAGANETRAGAAVGANATNVFVVFLLAGTGPNRVYQLPHKSTFADTDINPALWDVRLCAR